MPSLKLTRNVWSFDDTKLLGKPGGFGRVHPGTGPAGEPVAIKLLRSDLGNAANRELEFAEGHAGKPSKHLIPIFDAGVDPRLNQACIVMAVASESLRDAANRQLPMDEDAALEVVAQIASGLVEAGDWIHRDLKPENILFADGRWQITDFGIGRIAEATTATYTLKGALSPPYGAPEQWKGVRASHATDIYALGCIATELLTGYRPFAGPSIADFERQHQTEIPTIGQVSPRVRSLLLRMLAKPEVARPAVGKVIAEIGSIVGQKKSPGFGAQRLSAAGARVAEETAKKEATDAAAQAELESRNELAVHARNLLDGIADQLFSIISEQAPHAAISRKQGIGAFRKDKGMCIYEALLGQGLLRMTVGHRRLITSDVFAGSEWDIICWDSIFIQSATYSRSASLWYADVGRKSEYAWIEMAYWPLDGAMNGVPTHLEPGKEAAQAASRMMTRWNFANPIRVIEGDGTDLFCERWMNFLAQAAEGTLAYPGSLPEP